MREMFRARDVTAAAGPGTGITEVTDEELIEHVTDLLVERRVGR